MNLNLVIFLNKINITIYSGYIIGLPETFVLLDCKLDWHFIAHAQMFMGTIEFISKQTIVYNACVVICAVKCTNGFYGHWRTIASSVFLFEHLQKRCHSSAAIKS